MKQTKRKTGREKEREGEGKRGNERGGGNIDKETE